MFEIIEFRQNVCGTLVCFPELSLKKQHQSSTFTTSLLLQDFFYCWHFSTLFKHHSNMATTSRAKIVKFSNSGNFKNLFHTTTSCFFCISCNISLLRCATSTLRCKFLAHRERETRVTLPPQTAVWGYWDAASSMPSAGVLTRATA